MKPSTLRIDTRAINQEMFLDAVFQGGMRRGKEVVSIVIDCGVFDSMDCDVHDLICFMLDNGKSHIMEGSSGLCYVTSRMGDLFLCASEKRNTIEIQIRPQM